jgi:hypothetical protein
MTKFNEQTQFALDFVNSLVPDRFELAGARLSETCEYYYSGKVLRGEAIIKAFEESHERAKKILDDILYLPGVVDAIDGNTITIKVSDKISLKGRNHTYRDRLAVTTIESDKGWVVSRIEHLPYEEERQKLRDFVENGNRESH